MKNFINIDDVETTEVKKVNIKIQQPITEEIQSLEQTKIKIQETQQPIIEEIQSFEQTKIKAQEVEQELYVIGCDASDYYGDRDENGSFKVQNLFSELSNEFERATARQNLGIGDQSTLNWGYIKGNIENQEDLKQYVFESPQFKGYPTAPTQSTDDNSNAIATTAWVKQLLDGFEGGGGGSQNTPNLKSFTISPRSSTVDQIPVLVTASWEYEKDVSLQKLNGVILDNSERSKIIQVSETKVFTLEFEIGGITFSKTLTFSIDFPNYYGESDNYLELEKTTSSRIDVLCNDNNYVYIITPIENAKFSINGFIGGFKLISSGIIHGLLYHTYKSVNHSLGSLTINIIN